MKKQAMAITIELLGFSDYKALGEEFDVIFPRSARRKRPAPEPKKKPASSTFQDHHKFFDKVDLSSVPTLKEQFEAGSKSKAKLKSNGLVEDVNSPDFYLRCGEDDSRWSVEDGAGLCVPGELNANGIETGLHCFGRGATVQLDSSEAEYYTGFRFDRVKHGRGIWTDVERPKRVPWMRYETSVLECMCPFDDPVLSFSRFGGKIFEEVFMDVKADVFTLLRSVLCVQVK